MSIYYIRSIEEYGDIVAVVLAPVKYYERELTIHTYLLEEFAKENTVIGYNSVTKKLSVKRIEDVGTYLNSKLRLTGITTDDEIEIMGTTFKEVNSKVYYTHEIGGKTILVAEPLAEYNVYAEIYGKRADIKLTMPDNVGKNVDVIKLDWNNIFTPIVNMSAYVHITIDFPFTPKVIGVKPSSLRDWTHISEITFTDNFSMKGSNISKDVFDVDSDFSDWEIVQTEDGYELLTGLDLRDSGSFGEELFKEYLSETQE